MSSNKELVTGEIFVENDADRNEDRMFSAVTRVFGSNVDNSKAMVAADEEEGTVMLADIVLCGRKESDRLQAGKEGT